MPIAWDELDDPALRPDGFPLRTAIDRVLERGDLFRPVLGGRTCRRYLSRGEGGA